MITIQNLTTVPAGSASEYAATIGSLTKISGIQRTSLGRYLRRTANSDAGGVPIAGFQRFVLFAFSASFLATYAESKFNPATTPATPVGAISEFSATISSLSKIAGPQHTTLGTFPHILKWTLAPVLMGRSTRMLNGSWLISTPVTPPAVQLRQGMVVWVSC
jgi:hypothetical protein